MLSILLERLRDDVHDGFVDAGDELFERRRRLVDDAVQHAVLDVAWERALECEELVDDRADGENVRAMVDRTPRHLLGRHVVQRAHQRAGLRHAGRRCVSDARDAEVQDLQRSARVEHQVRRLDVAVNDAGAVCVREAVAELLHQNELLIERHLLALADHARERRAFDVLHRDEWAAHVLADVVYDHDVLVIKARVRARLALEPFAELVGFDVLAQQLDGEQAIHFGIAREVEGSHPAFAEALQYLVAAYRSRKRVFGSHAVIRGMLILVYGARLFSHYLVGRNRSG
ncbi:MAG TPA: hypothetical protein VIW45_15580 [Vicinamibacterales bacterium]